MPSPWFSMNVAISRTTGRSPQDRSRTRRGRCRGVATTAARRSRGPAWGDAVTAQCHHDGPVFRRGNNDAWSRLPREMPALPNWARMLVVSQPKTTAGVLALDYLHRMKNPLGNEIAAKVRWAVARELQCNYATRYAESDLKR